VTIITPVLGSVSPARSYTERFSVSDGGNVLRYSITITDPVIFTEPLTYEWTREWEPGVEVEPYDCVARRIEEDVNQCPRMADSRH
jgi:hypothetical protein